MNHLQVFLLNFKKNKADKFKNKKILKISLIVTHWRRRRAATFPADLFSVPMTCEKNASAQKNKKLKNGF